MGRKPLEPRGAVVVTGASSGIGRATALYLAGRGYQVLGGVRREQDGRALREDSAGRITPVLLDVTDPALIAAAAGLVTARHPEGLLGLVNNAGVALAGPLEVLPISQIRRQFEVNVIGQIALIQAFLPLLRQARGRIINIGSASGMVALPFLGPYAASKFSLEALTDSLRVELRAWQIPVVIVRPGQIETPIFDKSERDAEAAIRSSGPEAVALYEPRLEQFRSLLHATRRFRSSPLRVAQVVAKALAARRPATRYVVGVDAWLSAVARRLLPDRLRDWLIARPLREDN